jgi:hypothetical protein
MNALARSAKSPFSGRTVRQAHVTWLIRKNFSTHMFIKHCLVYIVPSRRFMVHQQKEVHVHWVEKCSGQDMRLLHWNIHIIIILSESKRECGTLYLLDLRVPGNYMGPSNNRFIRNIGKLAIHRTKRKLSLALLVYSCLIRGDTIYLL